MPKFIRYQGAYYQLATAAPKKAEIPKFKLTDWDLGKKFQGKIHNA